MNQQLLEAQAALRGLANEKGLNVEAGQQAAYVLAFVDTVEVGVDGQWGLREGITYTRDALVGIFQNTQALLERGLIGPELVTLLTVVIVALGVAVLAFPDTTNAQTETPVWPGQPIVTSTPSPASFGVGPDGAFVAQSITNTPPAEVGSGSGTGSGEGGVGTPPEFNSIQEVMGEPGHFTFLATVDSIVVQQMEMGSLTAEIFIIVIFNGSQKVALPIAFNDFRNDRYYVQFSSGRSGVRTVEVLQNPVNRDFKKGTTVNVEFLSELTEGTAYYWEDNVGPSVRAQQAQDTTGTLETFASSGSASSLNAMGSVNGAPILVPVKVTPQNPR